MKYKLQYTLSKESRDVLSLLKNHHRDYGDCFSPITVWDITEEEREFLEEYFNEIGFKQFRFSQMYTNLYV
jgi:hypothetical protein